MLASTKTILSKLILIILFFTFVSKITAQKFSDEYWKAILHANSFYDEAEYHEASKAYQLTWKTDHPHEIANHRLYAAAANCMIDNEEAVRENLFKILGVATKTDMKRVLVNYQIFDKYKETDWWKDLHQKMDERLAKLIAHHKNLKIFKFGRNIIYSAIRINNNKDTIANTLIHLIPDGTGWGDEAASSQSQVVFRYDYTLQDSLDHIMELDSVVNQNFWLKMDTTGIIENDSVIWMHPFRNNEFFKTELAPFPTVRFPISNETIQNDNSRTVIIKNWGTYTQTQTALTYQYIGEEKRTYPFSKKITCHHFKGTGENTRHGTSTIEYYFNKDFGFTEMIYYTYDGDHIIFTIDSINE